MALLEVLTEPDPRLHLKAMPVDKVDTQIRKHIDDMLETMYAAHGMGLAAIQVNIQKRIVVIDFSEVNDEPTKPLLMVNPELKWLSPDLQTTREACLSVPGQSGNVVRPREVEVSFLDENNQPQSLKASDLLADCIQHEIDHLDGILYIDHLSTLKRKMIMTKLMKLKAIKR